jgi:hypothetical protein
MMATRMVCRRAIVMATTPTLLAVDEAGTIPELVKVFKSTLRHKHSYTDLRIMRAGEMVSTPFWAAATARFVTARATVVMFTVLTGAITDPSDQASS